MIDDASDQMVFFYDGDPLTNGETFDVQAVPYVSPAKPFLAKAVYHPRHCGVHDLYIVANKGTPDEIVRQADRVTVACPVTSAAAQ